MKYRKCFAAAAGMISAIVLASMVQIVSAEGSDRDLDSMEAAVLALPTETEDLLAAGVVVVSKGSISNVDVWYEFAEQAASGSPASCDIAQVSNYGVVINHIDYNGVDFVDILDYSRYTRYLGSSTTIVRSYDYLLGYTEASELKVLAAGGGSAGDLTAWTAAGLASEAYSTLADFKDGEESDIDGDHIPVLLFEKRNSASGDGGIEIDPDDYADAVGVTYIDEDDDEALDDTYEEYYDDDEYEEYDDGEYEDYDEYVEDDE